ncbi:MAG: glycosyltransferase [Nitrososphaera sp.]|uniref:glycosyltransferase n=1 Tax=Nitrososphaera sp. TaxID=1971748 RepID=UPI0025D2F9F3|nr:glycosyltransferase [Nitrososphaera sp.]
MVMYGPGPFLYVVFIIVSWIIMLYTLNFYYLAYHSKNRKGPRQKQQPLATFPAVTIQLPLYNEKYVARRLISAVCAIDYPKEKMQIQVLDDSDDDTVDLIRSIVDEYRFKGFDIVHVRRTDRRGYKAGALKEGMKSATGEFIAIFDADFIPPANFLKHLLGHFDNPKMGFVQCKWGHVNEDYSTMTWAQAVSLDIHFLVEQRAKSQNQIILNFNGTAGIWRKSCIEDAGGWHIGTLVEDMDLSYRAQMRGWKCKFLDDFVVDAELPVQMNAAKRQQFRWAKGSIQVAQKLLFDVMVNRKVTPESKMQAMVHMTRHVVNPLFLAQFLIFPMLLAMDFTLYQGDWAPLAVGAVYIALGPGGYLAVINKVWQKEWKGKAKQFFFLNFFAAGMTVNNSVAVFDAMFGRKNEFLRTPKFGIVHRGQDWRGKEYVLPFTRTTLLEIFFAVYGVISIFIAIFSGNGAYAPLMAVPTIGFIYVAYLTIAHSQFGKRKGRRKSATVVVQHKKTAGQKILLPGTLAFLLIGAGLAYYGYFAYIYPLNEALGLLSRAETAQTPQQLAEYAGLAQKLIPEKGNPVWLFPTPRTDFAILHMQLDTMLARSAELSSAEPHTEAYSMAMADMHASSLLVQQNLEEAIPFIYISPTNLAIAGAWIAVILSIFAAMKVASAKHKREEAATVHT